MLLLPGSNLSIKAGNLPGNHSIPFENFQCIYFFTTPMPCWWSPPQGVRPHKRGYAGWLARYSRYKSSALAGWRDVRYHSTSCSRPVACRVYLLSGSGCMPLPATYRIRIWGMAGVQVGIFIILRISFFSVLHNVSMNPAFERIL